MNKRVIYTNCILNAHSLRNIFNDPHSVSAGCQQTRDKFWKHCIIRGSHSRLKYANYSASSDMAHGSPRTYLFRTAHNERTKRRRIPRARIIFIRIDSLLASRTFPLAIHFHLPPSRRAGSSRGGNTAGIHCRVQSAADTAGMHRHCIARADLKLTRLTCIPARVALTRTRHSRRISTAGIPRNFPRNKVQARDATRRWREGEILTSPTRGCCGPHRTDPRGGKCISFYM